MNADTSRELLHREVTDRVIKAFYETYNELGYGFLEAIYENAFCRALRDAGLEVQRQVPVVVYFRGEPVGEFRLDTVVEGCVIVEIKAASNLAPAHEAQLINYLKAAKIEVGLLLNFGPKAQFKRRALTSSASDPRSSAESAANKGL